MIEQDEPIIESIDAKECCRTFGTLMAQLQGLGDGVRQQADAFNAPIPAQAVAELQGEYAERLGAFVEAAELAATELAAQLQRLGGLLWAHGGPQKK